MTNSKLATFTDGELIAEIERRKKKCPQFPSIQDHPDWKPLAQTIIDGVWRSVKEGYEDEDFKHYVYEAAMEAVFGREYWIWRNQQEW